MYLTRGLTDFRVPTQAVSRIYTPLAAHSQEVLRKVRQCIPTYALLNYTIAGPLQARASADAWLAASGTKQKQGSSERFRVYLHGVSFRQRERWPASIAIRHALLGLGVLIWKARGPLRSQAQAVAGTPTCNSPKR